MRTDASGRDDADPAMTWPRGLAPGDADAFAHTAILIAARPSVVWRHLVEAGSWPAWHGGAPHLELDPARASLLDRRSAFSFEICGLRIRAVVSEFVPYSRLAWTGCAEGVRGCHAWLLAAVADGCDVVTEEVARGSVATRPGAPAAMRERQQAWLTALRRRAEG